MLENWKSFCLPKLRSADYGCAMALFKRNEPDESSLQFPYELIKVPGDEAIEKCLEWRKEWSGKFTPVILGEKEDVDRINRFWCEVKTSPEELMKKAESLNLGIWFEQRVEDPECMEDLEDDSEWNTNSGATGEFQSIADVLSQKVHQWVWVGKVPTGKPCEVPAYLKLGGWNECPFSEEHVAVWRFWQAKYGAEILCVTADVIEATVKHPPAEKEECYTLAREQFSYCSDVVTQGVGTIDALAATLYNGKSWYFWWD
jgi:Domain of unknown function (DUF4253)